MPADPNRILIVEDDAGLADLMCEGLQRRGLQVATVATGRDCEAWVRDHEVDLLLIDYSLPDMTGASLVEELHRGGRLRPFVVTTGHGDEEVAVQLMKLGALDYLVKDARLLERLPDVSVRVLREIAAARRLGLAEQALQQSEQRYRHLLASVTDYIYSVQIKDGQPVATSHGPGCAGVTGYAPADYAANPRLWLEMVHAEDRGVVEAHSHQATAGEIRGPIEHRILHKDGSVRWVQNTMVPRHAADGRLVACDGIVADITERKRAELALARDEAELAAIYDHAPVMMLLLDGERKVRRINQAALEFSAKKTQEALGLSAGELLGCLHALDDPRGCGFGPECSECPLRRATLDTLQHGTIHRRVETRPRSVRGRSVVDVSLLASTSRVVVANETLVLVCLEDISQQKIAEQRVREQAALLDVTRDAIVVVDLDDQVTYWNQGAQDLYGWLAGEVMGRVLTTLVFDQPLSAEAASAWQAIRQKGEWGGELRQRNRAGDPIVTLCRAC